MLEELVYCYLCAYHRGKDNLIKNKHLRNMFYINSDKAMRTVIQNIREDTTCDLIVGSISGRNGGFYICITEEEKIETVNNIMHRANEMLKMTRILQCKIKKGE